jgi:hypothetical protein
MLRHINLRLVDLLMTSQFEMVDHMGYRSNHADIRALV